MHRIPLTVLKQLADRASDEFHRMALAWQSLRTGRSRPVTLTRDERGFVQVHDGVRAIYVRDLAAARAFSGGIGMRLDEVAERYMGSTGYLPRNGDICVDVGAGIGEFAMWCRDTGSIALALEPDPDAFRVLEQNVAPSDDAACLPYALWKERADLQLHRYRDRPGGSLMAPDQSAPTVDVEAWPLDRVPVVSALPVIDLMKISGEGVEPEIILGGVSTMRRTRVVVVDLSAGERRRNLRDRVTGVLEELNFRLLDHGRTDTVFALNTAMAAAINSPAQHRRG